MTDTATEEDHAPAGGGNPVSQVREAAARVRAEHDARMAIAADALIWLVRPRWVIRLGITASTPRRADRWQAAANVALAALILPVAGLAAKGLLGVCPDMVVTAYAATLGVLKLIRVQLQPPFGDPEPDGHEYDDYDDNGEESADLGGYHA